MTEPATNTELEPEVYTFQEACRVLNVSEKTLRKAMDEGRISYIKLGEKTIRIPKAEIARMLEGDREG